MPKISLVVCLFRERDFLERLLRECADIYDDLVVVHDGPEGGASVSAHSPPQESPVEPLDYSSAIGPQTNKGYVKPALPPAAGSTHELVLAHQGKFFEGPRSFQQEPHWPFAWSQARHDWILRLDADEFPSAEMKSWLLKFRDGVEPTEKISGYTCIWPLWDGSRAVTQHWPAGRNFLFNRSRVRFFGMVEQVPIADDHFEALPLTLCHEPSRKSYGLRNILVRRQGAYWRFVIARSLLRTPLELPRWRWNSDQWPTGWARLRMHPIVYGFYSFVRGTLSTIRDQWRTEGRIMPIMASACPLHHFLIGLRLQKERQVRDVKPVK